MKILMLNYEFPPIGGGAANAHLALLKEYAGLENLKIDVLTSAPTPGFFTEKFSDNVTIYKVGLHKKSLHYWRKKEVIEWLIKSKRHYRRLLKNSNYDLAHAFFGFPTGWLCYRTAGKLPYIISLRGSDVPGFNIRLAWDYKLLSVLFRRIWHSAALIVANSEGLRKLALEFTPDLNIKVIPNGVDTERFYPAKKQRLRKPINLLTVCRLISRKRIDVLLEAVAKAKRSGLDIRFNIAGEGNLMESLKQLAARLGIEKSVNFMGRVPAEKMPSLYRDNDILIMSSAHEGMSNAMLEAMASGLPIITTRCEGTDELIKDNGIIVESPDANSIAETIKRLAYNKQMYQQMSESAAKHAQEFSWKSFAKQYLDLYQKTLLALV